MRRIAAALTALAASAAALNPLSCPNSSDNMDAFPNYEWSCSRHAWKGGVGTGQLTTPVVIHVPLSTVPAPQLQILIWNIDQAVIPDWSPANSAAFQVIVPNSDPTLPNPTTIPGGSWNNNGGSGPTWRSTLVTTPTGQAVSPVTYTQALSVDGACTGAYTIQVDGTQFAATSGNFGVAVRLAAFQNVATGSGFATYLGDLTLQTLAYNLPVGVGQSAGVVDARLPGQTLAFPVVESFATSKYMVRSFAVTVTAAYAAQVPPANAGTSVWGIALDNFNTDPFANQPTRAASTNQNQVTFTWQYVNVNANGAGQSFLRVTLPSLTQLFNAVTPSAMYQWGTVGPFFDFNVTFTEVTEYPTLFDFRSGDTAYGGQTIDVRSTITTQTIQQVYQVILDPLWWNTTVVVGNVHDSINNITVSPASVQVSYLSATPGSTQTYTIGGNWLNVLDTRSFSFYNPTFFTFAGPASVAADPQTLAPLAPLVLTRFFVAVSRSSCAPFAFTFGVTAASQTVANECRSFSDCLATSDHPSEGREDDSSNEKASRFTHCGVFNTGGPGMLTPTTKCFECLSDTDCHEGQYCHLDNGVGEDGNGNAYFVDPDSAKWMGLCRTKDTNILGQRCRSLAGAVQPFAAGSTPTTTFVVAGGNNHFANNNGFCGDVRTWNNSADGTYSLANNVRYDVGGTIRTVLWSGYCFNNLCLECEPTGYLASSQTVVGRTCVNGRLVDVKDVDLTVRTLLQNSSAGVLIAIAVSFLSFMVCFGCSMMADANRHREFFGGSPMTTKEVARAVFCNSFPCCKPAAATGHSGSAPAQPLMHNTMNPIPAGAYHPPTYGTA